VKGEGGGQAKGFTNENEFCETTIRLEKSFRVKGLGLD